MTLAELALFTALLMFLWILYTLYNDRRKMEDHYHNHVYAYKVGLISKKAKENDIELIFMENEDETVSRMEAEVEKDIK